MTCNSCLNKKLCKFYDNFNIPGIDIEVKSCVHKRHENEYMRNIGYDSNIFTNSTTMVKTQEEKPIVEEVRKSRAFQDLSELSNQKRKEQEREARRKRLESMNINTELPEDVRECPNCGLKDALVINCPICNKEVCYECSVLSVNPDTGTSAFICEECWKEDADNQSEDTNEEEIDIEVITDDTTE